MQIICSDTYTYIDKYRYLLYNISGMSGIGAKKLAKAAALMGAARIRCLTKNAHKAMARKGGKKTLELHGRRHFSKIGKWRRR